MNTKTLSIVTALAMGFAAPNLTAALVDQVLVTGNSQTLPNGYGPYQTGSGGEFTLQVTSGTAGDNLLNDLSFYGSSTKNQVSYGGSAITNSFQTFCVETSETISANTSYYAQLDQKTVNGGSTLTLGAAWLYSQFATGSTTGVFSNYSYSGGDSARETSAGLLQNAIWALMGLQTENLGNIYEQAAVTKFGTWAAANAASAGAYSVDVLTLWQNSNGTGSAQDQLILVGNPTPSGVPDGGATVVLLGMAFGGLAFFKRKLA